MTSLGKQLTDAARTAVLNHCRPGVHEPPNCLAHLCAGLSSVMSLLQQQEDVPGCSQPLLFRYVSVAHIQITQVIGAVRLQDFTFLQMSTWSAQDKVRLGQEEVQLETELFEYTRRTARWLVMSPQVISLAGDRAIEAATYHLVIAAEEFVNIEALQIVIRSLLGVRPLVVEHLQDVQDEAAAAVNIRQFFPSAASPEFTGQDLSD